ncbi:MAG: S8/S53 family peptidase [Myxococcota bacterium]|nr:S8/S53 family peptidase [Myxococcota bacterium]
MSSSIQAARAPRATPVQALDPAWHLHAIGAQVAWSLGLRGDGVRIGLVDGGVDLEHPELSGAVASGRIQVHRISPGQAPIPDHGTAVASLLVGDNQGLAREATLVVADVYRMGRHRRVSRAEPEDVRAGLKWLLEHGQVDLVLMTLERRGQDAWIRDLVQEAERSGILVVASIGNGGRQGETGSPGNYPEALGVGSLDRGGEPGPESPEGLLCWEDRRSVKPELLAPGSGVRVALCPRRYGWERGTSFAAPLVAGSAALLLQHSPKLGVAGLRERLGSGALDLARSFSVSSSAPAVA